MKMDNHDNRTLWYAKTTPIFKNKNIKSTQHEKHNETYQYIMNKSELVLNDMPLHYSDVIMGTVASQITSLARVYLTVHSGEDQRKLLLVTGLCADNSPVTSEFASQIASNAENVSIWWRHHEIPSRIHHLEKKETLDFLTAGTDFWQLLSYRMTQDLRHHIKSPCHSMW